MSRRTLTHQASFYEPRAILVVAIVIVLSVVNIAEASWGSSERKEVISRTTIASPKSKILHGPASKIVWGIRGIHHTEG